MPLNKSEQMARVRRSGTSPELAVRQALWAAGLHYRIRNRLPGSPDLVYAGRRIAVFVDGCFWHGCPRHYSAPRNRRLFWAQKLRDNVARDRRVDATLRAEGWLPIHVWECETKSERDLDRIVRAVRNRAQMAPTAGWYDCTCGPSRVAVTATSGPGGLSRRTRTRLAEVELHCGACDRDWSATPRYE